jgi:carbon-monoxide dehydrogenase small subunit
MNDEALIADESILRLRCIVNGKLRSHDVPVRMTLADYLRDVLGLTGTHLGCEQGQCGACTVRADGAVLRACLMLAVQAEGMHIDNWPTCRTPSSVTRPCSAASVRQAC